MTALARIAVLASGTGSNLQALLDACAVGDLDAEVVCVVSDRCGAKALERAENARVPFVQHVAAPEPGASRAAWDRKLGEILQSTRPDWVVLAGFMRLLSSGFLDQFPGRVVNLHPALPGQLPGTRAIERAFAEHQQGLRTQTGVMVHLVPDEGVDCGPVVASQPVAIQPDDSLDTLAARVHATEHRLLVEALVELVRNSSLAIARRSTASPVTLKEPINESN